MKTSELRISRLVVSVRPWSQCYLNNIVLATFSMWSSTLLCPQTQQKKIFPDIPDIPTSDNIVLAFQKKKEKRKAVFLQSKTKSHPELSLRIHYTHPSNVSGRRTTVYIKLLTWLPVSVRVDYKNRCLPPAISRDISSPRQTDQVWWPLLSLPIC